MATLLRLTILLACLALGGCSGLFFWPMEHWVQNPTRLGLVYGDVVLVSGDDRRIHGWWLPAVGKPRGTVYFLHGNAQNVSTHIMSVNWLPTQGYNVFMIDYRGFGLSEGEPRLPAVLEDVQAGFDWLARSGHLDGKPLIVLGQSLGASMAVPVLARDENQAAVNCAVLDSAFTGYRDIAGDAMRRSWILWPLRPLLLPLLPGKEIDPIERIADLKMPLLILHSRDDDVIPFQHGEALFEAATAPKAIEPMTGLHNIGLRQPGVQKKVMAFMNECVASSRPMPLKSAPAGVHF